MPWWGLGVLIATCFGAAVVGGAIGAWSGIDWHERRRVRDLRRKRANIESALDRESR
jgi:hypothetical protein